MNPPGGPAHDAVAPCMGARQRLAARALFGNAPTVGSRRTQHRHGPFQPSGWLFRMTTLLDPIRFGHIECANRIVMAPLTRNRAGPGQVPTPLMATYYGQRAGAGMIITEATQVSATGQGYLDTPGIHSVAQVGGWRPIAAVVHGKGGRLVMQLWHVGRISHTSLQPDGQQPVSSTSRRANTQTFTAHGFEDVSPPRALQLDELPGIVRDFRQAARNAMDAGCDGVEVHGANGYLLEQFLRDSINDRTDAYGGSKENRIRLAVEVMTAVAAEVGPGRAGLRLSPVTPANDAGQDSDAQGLYTLLLERLAPLKLAFVHVIEGATGGARDFAPFDYAALRHCFKGGSVDGAWVVNNGYTRSMAIDAMASGAADMVAFGRPFISNPDLVNRLRLNAPLAAVDASTLYGGGAAGYTDYPTMDAALADRLEPGGHPRTDFDFRYRA
jgi:N-ethylmaleimide reductase